MRSDLDRALADLRDTTDACDPAAAIVLSASRVMEAACQRAMGAAVTYLGWPVRDVAQVACVQDRRVVDPSPYRRVFPRYEQTWDRWFVAERERNRWFEPFATGLLAPEHYRRFGIYTEFFRPLGLMENGRILVCVGSRPVGIAVAVLPEGSPTFTDAERATLARVVPEIASSLRVAARTDHADAIASALDHLMASRPDAACIASGSGTVLAASPAAERALGRHPALADAIRRAVRDHRCAPGTATYPGLSLHVSPCSPRGGAPAYLVLVGEEAEPRRDRVSPRQAELLEAVAEGLGNAEIAARMGVAPSTVKTWLERLYRRTGTRNRTELARWSRRDCPPNGDS